MMSDRRPCPRILGALLLLLLPGACAGGGGAEALRSTAAGGVTMTDSQTGTGAAAVRLISIRERRFLTTIRQQADFSCGSAALATLLTFHYATPTREAEVFQAMMEAGDAERIRSLGFSFLDMQRYLATRGLHSNGYRMTLERLEQLRVPAIALIDMNGYRHFVVVRGVDDNRVLLADPNLGTRTMRRDAFTRIWNGILFFVTDRPAFAQATFGATEDWAIRAAAPVQDVRSLMDGARLGYGLLDQRYF